MRYICSGGGVFGAILVAALGLCAGCASSSGIQKGALDKGPAETFRAPFPRVVEATRQSMMELKLGINTDRAVDADTHMLVGEIGVSAFSYGEVVRTVIDDNRDDTSTVHVVTQRKLATNITAKGNWAPDIFKRVRQKLGNP